jgi:hypothetical protein
MLGSPELDKEIPELKLERVYTTEVVSINAPESFLDKTN